MQKKLYSNDVMLSIMSTTEDSINDKSIQFIKGFLYKYLNKKHTSIIPMNTPIT